MGGLEVRIRQRQALRELAPFLLDQLEPRDVVPTLLARRVIKSRDMTNIYSKGIREDRVIQLVKILETGDCWWGALIDAFIRTGHCNLAETLMKASNLNRHVTSFRFNENKSPFKYTQTKHWRS